MSDDETHPQMVAGKTAARRLGQDVMISFERRPEPWRPDDVAAIQHEDGSETVLVAEESAGEVKFGWSQDPISLI